MAAPVKPLTAVGLEEAALRYLERYAASVAQVRRVLLERVRRAVAAGVGDAEQGGVWVAALLARYQASGLLNDTAFAEAKTASLRRRGASQRKIQGWLAERGVAREDIRRALDAEANAEANADANAETGAETKAAIDQGPPELRAAWALARRRRLGPFRPPTQRLERRLKDLAVLARAGFSHTIARQVIDAPGEHGDNDES